MTSSRLRPNRSPSTPNVSSSNVTGTRKASEIQVSWEEEVPRSFWNRPCSTAGMASASWATPTDKAAANSVPRVSWCLSSPRAVCTRAFRVVMRASTAVSRRHG